MKRYFTIFKISLQQEFVYRLNFIMWRVRNVIQIFLIFFLWDSIFSAPNRVLFGYDRAKILTYVLGILVIKAIVFSSRTVDVSGEISSGALTNYLLKPVNYFYYWLTRDLSSKLLNLGFAVIEFGILFIILKPSFFLQTDFLVLLAFFISLAIAIFLFFLILFITSFIPFWAPELAWGAQFIVIVIISEFLSGALFLLDILPKAFHEALYLTPFPYLLFFPLEIYLGKIAGLRIVRGIIISLLWSLVLWILMKSIWFRGLKVYRAEGR